jgi:hypothetical protein
LSTPYLGRIIQAPSCSFKIILRTIAWIGDRFLSRDERPASRAVNHAGNQKVVPLPPPVTRNRMMVANPYLIRTVALLPLQHDHPTCTARIGDQFLSREERPASRTVTHAEK